MTLSAEDAIELSKSIIAEFHRYFLKGHGDNYEHVMAIKRIITATCRHFPKDKVKIRQILLDYALDLFVREWLRQAREEEWDEEEKEEQEEASRIFLRIYRTNKDAW